MSTDIPEIGLAELPERKKEKAQLLNLLKNSINSFVFGSQGVGKTTLIRNVAKKYDNRLGQSVYIDCLLYQTANAVLREILFSLGSIIASKSNYELTKRLREKAKKVKLAVFLDHAENLKDYEILKILFGLNLCVCLVSTSVNSYRKLHLSMRSRIPNVMELQPLPKEVILDILMERAGSKMDDDVLVSIAERVDGNITLAVNILDSMRARNAEDADLIEDFFSYQNDGSEHSNEDCELILQILSQRKKLPSGELFRLYQESAEFAKSERSFRKYMETLRNRNLVRSIGEKKGRVYEIVEN